MTAKQCFFLAIEKAEAEKAVINEKFFVSFCAMHRSVQWRKVGKHQFQVRFNDRETFQDIIVFMSNYKNRLMKDLNDRVVQAKVILNTDEIFECLPQEVSEGYRAMSDSFTALKSKYSELYSSALKVQEHRDQLEQQLNELHAAHVLLEERFARLQSRVNTCVSALHNAEGKLGYKREVVSAVISELSK